MADYLDKHGLSTLWQRIKEYVRTAIAGIEGNTPSSTTPKEDGDASVGTETAFARGDHRHPHDTSKVDKVDGKGLSSNDYTSTDKQKVDAIPSNWSYVTYTAGDGINIENGVISATGGGGEENVIEVVKVNGESLTPDANKAVNISVPNVPNWALQESKPSYDYSEIGNTPTIPTVPTDVSAFNNDAGYLTSHQDISGKADKATTLAGYGITDAKIEGGTITLGGNTITPLTSHQSLDNYVQKSQTAGLLKNDGTVDTTQYLTQHQDLSDYVQKSNTSGLLKNDGTVDTTQYGTYSKPANGIPASDLESGVIPTVPTNVSAFTNDAGYFTQHQSLSGYAKYVVISQSDYENLSSYDSSTLYLIPESSS